MENQLVSVILPTYNGVKYIKRAIESVLAQSFFDWELIIVDDGSSDNTEDIAKEYAGKDQRITYIKNDINLGIQKSLNKGLKEAKGKYIARIDDDDEWIDKDKLKKQVEFLNNNPDYALVGTSAIVVNEDGKELFRYLLPETDQDIRNKLLMKNCFVHSSVLFRKEAVLKFNGYSEEEDVKHLEDYDLWLKLGTVGKLANLPIYAVKFMLRDESISSVNKLDQLKKDLILTKEFKTKYPNYIQSLAFGYLRLYSFKIFNLISPLLKNKILKFYKEL